MSIQRTITLLLCLCILPVRMAVAQFSGGSGTSGDPWQIANATDLHHVDDTVTYYDDHFILTASIDWGDVSTNFPLFPRQNQGGREDGIAAFGGAFTFGGTFDGNGYVISNSTRCFFDGGRPPQGGSAGVVRNVIITNALVACTYHVYDSVGRGHGVYYATDNNNTPGMQFYNCQAYGVITNTQSSYATGGLIGSAASSVIVSNCVVDVDVYGFGPSGGIIGSMGSTANIKNSHTYGLVNTTSGNDVGGMVGQLAGGTIFQSSAHGEVHQSPGFYAGGLVGEISGSGTIRECFATGDVRSSGEHAGLVGATVSGTDNTLMIDSYATGNAIGSYSGNRTGGFMGEYARFGTGHIIENCYSTGDMNSGSGGGFSGQMSTSGGIISNCFAAGGTVAGQGFHAGNGVVYNSYWTNSASSDSFATKVGNESYFYAANAPIDEWDTTGVWCLDGSSLPCLRWDENCCPPAEGMVVIFE